MSEHQQAIMFAKKLLLRGKPRSAVRLALQEKFPERYGNKLRMALYFAAREVALEYGQNGKFKKKRERKQKITG